MSIAVNLIPNPYFDPNPIWLFTILKIWCIAGVLTTVLSYYMIIFQSPAYNKASFRYAMLYHIFVGFIFQLHYTFLTQPLIYLPYMAMEMHGIWSALEIDADIQLALLISLIIIATSVIIPFIYYRMDCLLPPHHPLNRKYLHYGVYFMSYGVSHFLPMPLLIAALRYTDRNVVKKYYEDTYHIYLEGFWKKEVATAAFHDNPWACAFLLLMFLIVFFMIGISFGCTAVVYHTVRGNAATVSEQMRRDRKRMLTSLVALMIIICSVGFIVAPTILYTVLTASLRCDIFNIMVAWAGAIYPSFIFVYVISYKPYRDASCGILRKMREHMGSRNATIIVPVTPNNKY